MFFTASLVFSPTMNCRAMPSMLERMALPMSLAATPPNMPDFSAPHLSTDGISPASPPEKYSSMWRDRLSEVVR